MKPKYLISIDGVDSSGKTTLVKNLKKFVEKNFKEPVFTTMNMNLHKLCREYPKNKKDIENFYKNSSAEKITFILLQLNKKKAELAINSKAKYVLLDRGYFSTIAQCVAHIRAKKDIPFEKALKIVEQINRKIKYKPIEKNSLILFLSQKRAALIFKKRIKPKKYHLSYLVYFSNALNKIIKSNAKNIRVHLIDATKNIKGVYDGAREIYAEITDLNYHLYIRELLKKVNKKDFESISLGGSYARKDLVSGWSDLDGIFVLKERANREKIKKLTERLSKRYNIKFNPRLITEKDLKDSSSLQMKVVNLFLRGYKIKVFYGKRYFVKIPKNLLMKRIKKDGQETIQFLENMLKTEKKPDEEKIKIEIRNCFTLVKRILLEKGVVASSYKETILYAKRFKIKGVKQLEMFLAIRNNWGYEKPNYKKILNQIKNFLGLIKEYF